MLHLETLQIVYRSLIRSILDYGAIDLDSMSETNKKKFEKIQAQALRICSGALRGTANAALQVDMGEPPLQLRRLQQQLKYAAKSTTTENHPAAKVFEPHWTTRRGKYNEHTFPIYNKVAEFFDKHQNITWESPFLPPLPP